MRLKRVVFFLLPFYAIGAQELNLPSRLDAKTEGGGESQLDLKSETEPSKKFKFSDLLYLPYEEDFLIAMNADYAELHTVNEIPAQTLANGNSRTAERNEFTDKLFLTRLNVMVGVTDYFSFGIGGSLQAAEISKNRSSSEASSETITGPSGMISPVIFLNGRFAGTRKDDWILDARFSLLPMVRTTARDSVARRQYQMQWDLVLGRKWGYVSTAFTTSTQYSSGNTVQGVAQGDFISIIPGISGQLDIRNFFLQSGFGVQSFVDNGSRNDPLRKLPQLTLSFKGGFTISDQWLFAVGVQWFFKNSADYSAGETSPTPATTTTVGPQALYSLMLSYQF